MDIPQTAELVRDYLEHDIYLRDALHQGIVNNTALARKMLPDIQKINKASTVESISVAIARYTATLKKIGLSAKLKKIIAESQVMLKNKVTHLTFSRNQANAESINDISARIRWDSDEICLINQGAGEITVIIDDYNFPLFHNIRNRIIDMRDTLVLITIRESVGFDALKGIDVPGLYSYFITNISKKGINLIEIISTASQISLLVEERHAIGAYNVINKLIKFSRETLHDKVN